MTATDWSFRATDITKVYADGRVCANDAITRLGPYDLVAEPDTARQMCSYLPGRLVILDEPQATGW